MSQLKENQSPQAELLKRSGSSALTRSELRSLQDAFSLFDTEQKGEISIGELKSVLIELGNNDGSECNISNLRRLISSLESMPSDGMLRPDDFIRIMTTPNPSDTRDEMKKVFDLFDDDEKGYITVRDLQKVAHDLGETMEEEELNEMIQRVSPSGKVKIDQFRDIMNKKLFS